MKNLKYMAVAALLACGALNASARFLLKKEKHIYDTYLCKYDYCELLSADYQ